MFAFRGDEAGEHKLRSRTDVPPRRCCVIYSPASSPRYASILVRAEDRLLGDENKLVEEENGFARD